MTLLPHSSSSSGETLLCLLILACPLLGLARSVTDAEGLWSALLDSSTTSISLQGPVVLDASSSSAPVALNRAVSITAATPAAYLDFGSSQQPLISIQPGGNLTLLGLLLLGVHPPLPLPLSDASSLMPTAAVNSSSSAAHLVISRCVLLVRGPPSNLTDTLPFWAARQQAGDLQPLRTPALSTALSPASASSTQQPNPAGQFVSFISSSSTAPRRGSSSVQVADTAVVFDPAGCITPGQHLLAWDSTSLSQALQSARSSSSSSSSSTTPQVLLLADTILSPAGWSWAALAPNSSSSTPSVHISSCSSIASPTVLDLNHLPGAFLLQPGATLTFSSGLALLHAAAVSQVYNSNPSPPLSWPYSNRSSSALALLTLGSVDVSRGGQLILQDVVVGVPDAAAAQAALQQVTGAGGSKPSLQPSAAAAGTGFAVSGWNTSLAGWSLGGTSAQLPAAEGARLVMQDVSVQQQAPSVCGQQGSSSSSSTGAMAVSTEAQLLAALTGADTSTVLVTANITLRKSTWQGLNNIRISQPVLVIHGCRGSDGQLVAVDFSELQVIQAQPMFLVSSQLQFSGDLALLGIPDYSAAAGSWVLLPLFQLTGPGSMVFQGVQMQGYSQPRLQDMGSAPAAGRATVVQLSGDAVLAHLLTLPRSGAAQLAPAMYSNSTGGSSINKLRSQKLRSMLAEPNSTSSSSTSRGGGSGAGTGSSSSEGYYAWVGTQLDWGPRVAAAASRGSLGPGSVAAIVLGTVLGLVLLAAAAALLLHQRRQRQQGQQWKLGAGNAVHDASSKDTSCWNMCCPRSQGQQQLLQPGLDSSYGDFASSGWAGQQVPPCASVLASFGSYARDASLRAGLAYHSNTSQAAAGTLNGPVAVNAGMLVHTSPNSGTTGASLRGAAGPGVDAAHLHDLVLQHQQHTGLEVEQAGPSFPRTGTEACLAAAAAGVAASAAAAAAGTDARDATDASGGDDAGGQKGGGGFGQYKQQVFEAARKQLGATAGDLARSDALVLEAVLGEGSFGKVFRGYWKGTLVAVKTMMFPAAMSGKEKREKMAIMETAISAMLSHPNIVQMYTYYLRPVLVGHEATLTGGAAEEAARLDSSSVGDSTMNAAFLNEGLSDSVHSWEVQLVLEYCDKGSLRALLNKQGTFALPDGRRDMVTILDTALDVARAMVHLHSQNIIHSDLKARNILLKSSGGAEGRPFTAKVADFGLSMRIDPNATHVSNVYQGTMTHMAPETMLRGKLSRSSDVYAFGVLLWELCTGGHAFKGIPRALLGHEVTHQQRRPQFPDDCPFDFQLLACRCWESDASIRPSFAAILAELLRMRERMAAAAAADQAAAAAAGDAQPAADASGAAGGGGTAVRPQSEPLQAAPRATMAAAAAVSDPVQGLRMARGAEASAMVATAAGVAAAAAGNPAAPAVQASGAARGEAAASQHAAAEAGEALGGLPPSGPLPSHSIPLLLPAPDELPPGQQPGMQAQLGGTGQVGILAQQQQHQQGSSVGAQLPGVAGGAAQAPEQQHQSPQQELLHAQQPAAQHSDSILHHAMLDDVMLQVSITGGSSLFAGNLVVPPQHQHQQLQPSGAPQHSWPEIAHHHHTAYAPGQHSSPLPLQGGAAAAAAAAAAGSTHLHRSSAADDAALAGQAAMQHQQEPDRSEYFEESSSASAVGRGGVVCYGATRHRSMWCGEHSTATASEEGDEGPCLAPAGSAAAAGAAAAAAAAVAMAAAGDKQHSPQLEGDSSSGYDQGVHHAQPAASAGTGAGTAAPAAAVGKQGQADAAGAAAGVAVAGAASPVNGNSGPLSSTLARLSLSARNFLRPASNASGAAAAAAAGPGEAAAASAGTSQLPLALADASAGAVHQGVVGLSDVLPQQQLLPPSAMPVQQPAHAPTGRPAAQYPEPQQEIQLYGRVEPAAQATRQVHFAPQAVVASGVAAPAATYGAGLLGGTDVPLRACPPEPSVSGGSHSVTVYSSGDSSAPRSSSLAEPGSSSSGGRDGQEKQQQEQPKLSETEAAIAAVMSLKATLAKQAFAGGIARQRSATAAAANRLSVDSGLAAAASVNSAAVPAAGAARHSFDVATARAYAHPVTGPEGLRTHSAYAGAAAAGVAPGLGAAFGYRALQPQQHLWGGAAGAHPAHGREGMFQLGLSGPLSPGAAAGRGAMQARPPPSPVPGVARGAAAASAPPQPLGPLPLHAVQQQLAALEVQMRLPAEAGDSWGGLSAPDGARQRTGGAAGAHAAAAAAAPLQAQVQGQVQHGSHGPAASRSWHTGLTNLASQLLQPAFSGPRSPKLQQQQQQQTQTQQQQLQQRATPRWSPRASWKPPVRKTVSASQLGTRRASFFAGSTAASTPHASGALPGVGGTALLHNAPSQPLPPVLAEESTQATGDSGPSGTQAPGPAEPGAAAAGRPDTQARLSLQLPLPLGSLQVAGAADGPEQLGLAGLDPAQLQLLAQIADAARAQVSPLSVVGEAFGDQHGDSLGTQHRWRSAPSAGPTSEPLAQQGPHTARPRPQHTASLNQLGVRQYGTTAAATQAAAACSTPRSAAAPLAVPGSGASGQGQKSPGGRARRSSAPVMSQQQQQLYKQLLQQQQQQQQVLRGQQP